MKYERLQYHIGLLARVPPGVVIVGCTKANGRKTKSCLGQVFNFKIGCFYYECNFMVHTYTRPRLELKTQPENTKGGSITVQLTSCLTCLYQSVLQIKTKIVICQTADSKPIKQEVNSAMILPPIVFPDSAQVLSHQLQVVYDCRHLV